MSKSNWMRGLLYAEKIGAVAAEGQLYRYEFDDGNEFERGVVDYIIHHKRLVELAMESANG